MNQAPPLHSALRSGNEDQVVPVDRSAQAGFLVTMLPVSKPSGERGGTRKIFRNY